MSQWLQYIHLLSTVYEYNNKRTCSFLSSLLLTVGRKSKTTCTFSLNLLLFAQRWKRLRHVWKNRKNLSIRLLPSPSHGVTPTVARSHGAEVNTRIRTITGGRLVLCSLDFLPVASEASSLSASSRWTSRPRAFWLAFALLLNHRFDSVLSASLHHLPALSPQPLIQEKVAASLCLLM